MTVDSKFRPLGGLSVLAGALAASLVLFAAPTAGAAQLLEVTLDPDAVGTLRVGVRDAGGKAPVLKVSDEAIDAQVAGRTPSSRYKPAFLIVDTSNISADLLSQVKDNVTGIARREFAAGSQLVRVGDQGGGKLDATSAKSVDDSIRSMIGSWEAKPPNADKPEWSTIGAARAGSTTLELLFSGNPIARAAPWALVFSSLCVAPEDPAPDLSPFNGPITFLTWDEGLSPKCLENRAAFFEGLKTKKADVSMLRLDDPADSENVKKAREGRAEPLDEFMTLSGINYIGGSLTLRVELEGSEPWQGGYTPDKLPEEWDRVAKIEGQKKRKNMILAGLGVAVLLILISVVIRARSAASEINKWEVVGEAEEVEGGAAAPVDPDAWNATIFQLTGAMPALKDVVKAAQLGPSAASDEPETRPAPPEKPAEETTKADASEEEADAPPSTGMTVAMPVFDDGTGYEANTPFEVGVLLNGKPVARKTKKFRKVFSIGRATDNRVVIQKDDTVHRYHVVIRPALQGKEWWLEVSPTATNRTNLNGKDLRAGGRYRLPARFRLQLGEATEIRGRLSDS